MIRRTVSALIVMSVLAMPSGAAAVDIKKIDAAVVRVLMQADVLVTLANGKVIRKKRGGTGTGFVVNKSMVVTNLHVVYPNKPGKGETNVDIIKIRVGIRVRGIDKISEVEVIKSDPAADLAVLRAEGLKTPILPISQVTPDKGLKVHSLGFPGMGDRGDKLSWESSLSSGIVEKLEKWSKIPSGPPVVWVQHSATVRRGNSGGPLFNDCGEVVGVNTLVRGAEIVTHGGKAHVVDASLSFASHASALTKFLKQNGYPFTSIDAPCQPTVVPAATWLTPANMVAIAASVFALIIALLNRARITSAASTIVGRPPREPEPPNGKSPSQPTPAPTQAPKIEKGWQLVGSDGRGRPLRFTLSAAEFAKAGGNLVIGRDGNIADLVVGDDDVSSRHLRLTMAGGGIVAEDLGSSNGTRIDGRALAPYATEPLPVGTTLAFGGSRVSLQAS